MEAKQNSFKGITTKEKKFEIPFFQRAYVWKKENWKRLFDDLLQSYNDKSSPFLGSIILKRNQGLDNVCYVIDGQQRLTTFSILLKSIIDQIDEQTSKFEECLFDEKYKSKEIKISHSYLDRQRYEEVLTNKQNKCISNNIYDCYNYFTNVVKENFASEEEKFRFADDLITKDLFVVVNIEQTEDEQKIFDSINSTGEKLTATDIVKNAIFDKALKVSNEDTAINLYNKYWRDIFEKDEEELSFWNGENKVARASGRVRSEILLHAVAIILGFYDVTKGDKIEQLSSLYKEYIADFNIDRIERFLKDIRRFAKIFREIQFEENDLFSYDNKRQMFFHTLKEFDANTFMPLALLLIDRLSNDTEKLYQCFNLIQSFIVYRYLCKYETSGYNKMIQRIISTILKSEDDDIIYIIRNDFENNDYGLPSNEEITSSFFDIKKNKQAKYILFWIELFREYKNKDYKDRDSLNYVYQLEHLMPQKWEKNWNIGKDNDDMEKLIYQIGNMTLLKGKLNSLISNADWNTKLNGDGKSRTQCISKNADLMINKELLDKSEWGEKEINIRSKELINDFFQIWNYNDEPFEVNHEDIQLNLSLQPKRKRTRKNFPKLLSVTFPDKTKICETKVIGTFIKSIEKIGFDKVMNLGLQCRKVDLISKTKQILQFLDDRQGDGVKEYQGYFIVSNSSTEQKMRYLKEISDRLGLNLIVEEIE